MEFKHEIELFNGSRKWVRAGDVFYYKLENSDTYFYGKVIIPNIDGTHHFFVNKSILLFLYKTSTTGLDENISLDTSDIYTAIFTGRQAWTKGMFHTFKNEVVTEDELKLDGAFLDYLSLELIDRTEIEKYDSYCYIEKLNEQGSYAAHPYVDWYCKKIGHVPKYNFGTYIFLPYQQCNKIVNFLIDGKEGTFIL